MLASGMRAGGRPAALNEAESLVALGVRANAAHLTAAPVVPVLLVQRSAGRPAYL